ncbi:MAG: hypothetical protein HOQ36_22140 [Nocardia sp.]|nr:hypothetical protein [Nocardia sp.]
MSHPASTRARLRGAFVGAASGTVSIAAHAIGGGTVTLGHSATALLLGGCAIAGALATTLRTRRGPVPLPVLLVFGQVIGHSALAAAPGHQHGSASTAPMLMAHLLAIPVGALLIHAAERAAGYAISRLKKALHGSFARSVVLPRAALVPRSTHRPVRRLLLCSGAGTRGPPLPVVRFSLTAV